MNDVSQLRRTAWRLRWVGPAPRIAVKAGGAGAPVVFLHGIGGNRSNWDEQLDVVSAQFMAAAWDARGYGESDDYEGALDFADFSRDLLRVLDALEADAAHLVGASMGGRIALDFYARHPARVATLTLANTSVASEKVASPAEVARFLELRKRPLLEGRTPAEIAEQVAETLVGPATSAAARSRMVASLAALHRDSYLKTLDAVTRYSAFPAFESIAVPCLVIAGEHDRIATPDHAASMARRIPGARLAVIQGGSHISNIDRPAAFNAALLPFLQQHAARAAVRC